jgi:hypothetical protein
MFGLTGSSNTQAAIKAASRAANANTIYPFQKWGAVELSVYMASFYIKHNKAIQLFTRDFCVYSKERTWEVPVWSTDDDFSSATEGAPTVPTGSQGDSFSQGILMDAFNKKFAWTRQGMHLLSLEELNEQLESHTRGHRKLLARKMLEAFFTPLARSGRDMSGDKTLLTQYPFANGDGTRKYPASWKGGGILSAHNHYLGRSGGSFAGADLNIAATHLTEHYRYRVNHMVGTGSQALITGLPGFIPVREENVHYSDVDRYYEVGFSKETDAFALEPVFLGTYGGRRCWSCWWIPDNYVVSMIDAQDKNLKPLRFRVPQSKFMDAGIASRIPMITGRDGGMEPGYGELQILRSGNMADIFTAQESYAEFGIASHNPLTVVITDMLNVTYTEPTPVLGY